MNINSASTVANTSASAQPVAEKYTAVALASLVGVVMLFVAGFAETSVLHSAAHDSRHSVTFPCH